MLGSCNRHYEVPFPFDEPEFPQPVARPFHFSLPAPAIWKDLSVSPFVSPVSKPLDLEKIPSRPFEIDGFYPLPKAPGESPLDWDQLPDTAFNLQSVPATVFHPEYSALGEPEIIPIRNPRVPANASEAIQELSDLEGLPS